MIEWKLKDQACLKSVKSEEDLLSYNIFKGKIKTNLINDDEAIRAKH